MQDRLDDPHVHTHLALHDHQVRGVEQVTELVSEFHDQLDVVLWFVVRAAQVHRLPVGDAPVVEHAQRKVADADVNGQDAHGGPVACASNVILFSDI